jgi:hypothetical protein
VTWERAERKDMPADGRCPVSPYVRAVREAQALVAEQPDAALRVKSDDANATAGALREAVCRLGLAGDVAVTKRGDEVWLTVHGERLG